jgi:ribonuclease P protein subunit POP4
MMALTPETLVRHELNGLPVVVVADSDERARIAGEVIGATMQAIRIDSGERTWTIPKRGATFEITLPDGDRVVIEGERLIARPARRTETAGGSKWRSA